MYENENFVRTILRRALRGFLLMPVVIFLSIAAAVVFYLIKPAVEIDNAEFTEVAKTDTDYTLVRSVDTDNQE